MSLICVITLSHGKLVAVRLFEKLILSIRNGHYRMASRLITTVNASFLGGLTDSWKKEINAAISLGISATVDRRLSNWT